MRPYKNRLSMLALCATAAVVPVITATDVEASSRHLRKHHARTILHYPNAWASGEIRPVAPRTNFGGSACPGSGRGIDCKIWPPPFEDDPDRKISGSDGGG
jgi:hypothetical protein